MGLPPVAVPPEADAQPAFKTLETMRTTGQPFVLSDPELDTVFVLSADTPFIQITSTPSICGLIPVPFLVLTSISILMCRRRR
jgi:hypothetical protein